MEVKEGGKRGMEKKWGEKKGKEERGEEEWLLFHHRFRILFGISDWGFVALLREQSVAYIVTVMDIIG